MFESATLSPIDSLPGSATSSLAEVARVMGVDVAMAILYLSKAEVSYMPKDLSWQPGRVVLDGLRVASH